MADTESQGRGIHGASGTQQAGAHLARGQARRQEDSTLKKGSHLLLPRSSFFGSLSEDRILTTENIRMS